MVYLINDMSILLIMKYLINTNSYLVAKYLFVFIFLKRHNKIINVIIFRDIILYPISFGEKSIYPLEF